MLTNIKKKFILKFQIKSMIINLKYNSHSKSNDKVITDFSL